MHKYRVSESGFFNPRIFCAFLLCSAGAWLAMFSFAAKPALGTISDTGATSLSYTAGPFNVSNPTPVIEVDSGPECHAAGVPGGKQAQPCDDYALTANISSGYVAAHPNASIKVTASWTDTGSGNSDYDLYVFKNPRSDCNPDDCTETDGTQTANYQSASGANPEIASIFPLVAGTQKYTIVIVPYTATGEIVNVSVELLEGADGGGGGGTPPPPFGDADPTVPGNPRYQNFYAPAGTSAQASSGEFNIGFNPATGHIMTMNFGPIWRLTTPENLTPAQPECCEALWQDRSSTVTDTGLDPILFTDQVTGRTFASNSTQGASGIYAYTDDDGEFWNPVSAAPVDGADHQTIGTGPYPASLASLTTPLNQGQYVLYCSQDLLGANCQRSDTLGSLYGPGVVATGPGANNSQGCGGLHGHVRVAPDGTAWLPDKSCTDKQGGAITLDASTTIWTEFSVSGTNDINGQPFTTTPQADGADPSIALDSDSTAYFCYVNNEANGNEGHVHVAVGKRNDLTDPTKINWIRDVDVGIGHGIINAAHPEAIGGTSGRAACGFFGTNKPGDYEAEDFSGNWYSFIATTYDEGRTWVTVNATPNDPIQKMTGIWQKGGGERDRNLLDFNEITVDAKGRVLYGYSDGCTSDGCVNGTAPNDYTAFMRVARQFGGKPLFSQFDPNPAEPVLPKPPCLSGTRSPSEVILNWRAPDNGGADIIFYKIYRSNTAGNEVFIGQTADASTNYRDQNPPNDPDLFYRVLAVNGQGEGPLSNEIDLQIVIPPPVASPCDVPGVTLLVDPLGDTSSALGIVTTPAPPGADLATIQLAQPYQNDGVPRLVFTIKTDPNATDTEAPGFAAYVAMKINGDDPTTTAVETVYYRAVRMAYKPNETFESYTPSPNNSGGVDGRFVESGSEKPAEPGSNYDGPSGTITIIVKASDLDLPVGSVITGFLSATSQTTDPVGVGVAATALYDQAPDSLAFAGGYTVVDNNTACGLFTVVSRRTHGSAGVFDITLVPQPPPPAPSRGGGKRRKGGSLPSAVTAAVEPRGGTHTLVYSLGATVTNAGTVSVSPSGSGTAAVDGSDPTQVIVTLSGIPNAEHVIVTLNGAIAGGTTLGALAAPMDVLLGDTTIDGSVNSADIGQTKSRSGQVVDSGNFRNDVTVDGTLNSADIGLVKSKSGTALP